MKEYKTVIDKMNAVVNSYRNLDKATPLDLLEFAKLLSTALYYLSTVRATIHNKFQIEVKELIDSGSPVSRAENEAHIKYPQLYELRNVTKAAYEILGIIRTNISYIKQEMNNLNIN